MEDLLARPALEQSARVRAGEVSCAELTRAYLDRVARRNGQLGAFVELAPERALGRARALDRERGRDPSATRSPLWGLPTGLKDLHLTRGFFARMGSRAFRWLWSPVDDVTSSTVRRAGLVIMGKLATPELGIMPVVETDLHPPTRNPWDPERTSGGSSGGSAAAIASCMVPIAAGSDGAGSIRIPAAFCGLFGHKPTRDLVPNPHRTFETLGISVVGPLARSVDDTAALLDLLTGREHSHASFLRAVQRPPRRLRMRFTTISRVAETEAHNARAVHAVVSALSGLGHEVEEGAPFEGNLWQFLPMFEFLAAHAPVVSDWGLQPVTRWLRARGKHVSAAQAAATRDDFTRRMEAWFEGVDVWVTPTVAVSPPRVGAFGALPAEEAFTAAATLGAFTAAFNASGMPAVTVPVRLEGQRWPVGVQLAGRCGEDARLLSLARELSEALGTPLSPHAPFDGAARATDGAPHLASAHSARHFGG